jgi:hypothetical protein
MNLENLKTLSEELQKAFDAKDLETVLGYYHPDIVLISPSSPTPVVGIDAVREAIARQFASPQRTSVALKDISVYPITDKVNSVVCRVTGYQSVYYSSYRIEGLLTRIFIDTAEGPKVVGEHLSLLQQ